MVNTRPSLGGGPSDGPAPQTPNGRLDVGAREYLDHRYSPPSNKWVGPAERTRPEITGDATPMTSQQPTQPPPPPPWAPPEERFANKLPGPPRWIIVIVAICVLVIAGAAASGRSNSGTDDDSGRKYTLVEAACKSLREGRDSEFTYGVMKRLAAQHPLVYGEDESIAARAAVEQAEAQGCG